MTQTRSGMRLLLVVGVVFSALASQRFVLYGQGDIAVWENAAAQSAGARPWNNLGNAYHAAGRDDDAEVAYLIALDHADQHRSEAEWRVGGALAQANLSALYLQAPRCGQMDPAKPRIVRNWPRLIDPVDARCNNGIHAIAEANDRWPGNPDIHARFLAWR